MRYYINEWSDHMACLITEDSYVLDNYGSGIEAYDSDCLVEPEDIKSQADYLELSPLDFDSSFQS